MKLDYLSTYTNRTKEGPTAKALETNGIIEKHLRCARK